MKVFILTDEKTIYEGETISLQAIGMNGSNGSFQLLDHHTSMIVFFKKVSIQIDKNKLISPIKNGILEVRNGIVKILINS